MTDLSEALKAKLATTDDLYELSPEERRELYYYRCGVMGLDPTLQPLGYIDPSGNSRRRGKLILYAKKGAADQLVRIHELSKTVVEKGFIGDSLYFVHIKVTSPDGRETEDIGSVEIKPTVGLTDDPSSARYPKTAEQKLSSNMVSNSNSIMRAITKASRRAVLSHVGAGMLDESELDGIPGATPVSTPAEPSKTAGGEKTVDSLNKRIIQSAEESGNKEGYRNFVRQIKGACELKYDGEKYVGTIEEYEAFVTLAEDLETFKEWMSQKSDN